ncbi:MAG: hypothetical protein A2381_06710 [Bdellovibrionales bacterium RIFOXYB1_FULL_37_110]|nr:MAG: hypothetical protein A2181_08730 [Bdellovibrionales bacterium RIFOXYA1_FULL_38_20]OFZ50233.1 MAG: hypothetical protein A2417_19560 [Bdellovibrionales bacterium RIFOXYC1_FULL_37_79]OFZ57670.1 MAG: hypothetical protein A2381_06710 [Bdellovibrionales bacterium RIFOXYB1_FULL_37_110]OFZ61437.1 MAG: hypothetical protein A2577_01075 [Bdellovibrionales bacterium RIFOXYD1_FULL_36_51]
MVKRFVFKVLFLGGIFFLFIISTYGVESINALLFDETSQVLKPSRVDPFNYLFDTKSLKQASGEVLSQEDKETLGLMRGFFQEGNNLVEFCQKNNSIDYTSLWDENTVKRTLLANIQYHGLKIVMQAIGDYAAKLGLSREDFLSLKNNLIENHCSKNISFVSRKNLHVWFASFFQEKISDSSLKASTRLFGISQDDNCKECLELEMNYNILLFRSFCSWGGSAKQLRFLSPIIKNPMFFAYFLREMFGEKLNLELVNNVIFKTKLVKEKIILCEDLMCRKVYVDEFHRKVPRSLGGADVYDDLKRLYCSDFKDANLNLENDDEIFKTWAKELGPDDYYFQLSQLSVLINKVPDVILRHLPLYSPEDFFLKSLDQSWYNWSQNQLKNSVDNVYYEEPLRLEVVSRNLFFDVTVADFRVMIDVNLGEIDRSSQILGKIPVEFNVTVPKSLLNWFRKKRKEYDPSKKQNFNLTGLVNRFEKYIVKDIQNVRDKFTIPPWDTGLERLVSNEILEQIAKYEGKYFEQSGNELVKIPVQLNYAPFALKYIRHKFLTQARKNDMRASQSKK